MLVRAAVLTLALALLAPAGVSRGDPLPIGDVNGDCSVTSADIGIVAVRYGASFGSLLYSSVYDLNHDGRIGVADLQIIASHFGDTC